MEPMNGMGAAKSATLYYAIGGVVVLCGAAYLFWGGHGDRIVTREDAAMRNDQEMETVLSTEKKSLRALLGMTESVACDFAVEDPHAGKSSGTVYIAGGKMRGDFSSVPPVGGKTIESHMIIVDDTTYVWSPEGMGYGMKMHVPEASDAAVNTTPSSDGAPNWDAAYDYHCSSWTADSAKFALPTGVEFTDMEAMMRMQGVGGMKMPR